MTDTPTECPSCGSPVPTSYLVIDGIPCADSWHPPYPGGNAASLIQSYEVLWTHHGQVRGITRHRTESLHAVVEQLVAEQHEKRYPMATGLTINLLARPDEPGFDPDAEEVFGEVSSVLAAWHVMPERARITWLAAASITEGLIDPEKWRGGAEDWGCYSLGPIRWASGSRGQGIVCYLGRDGLWSWNVTGSTYSDVKWRGAASTEAKPLPEAIAEALAAHAAMTPEPPS